MPGHRDRTRHDLDLLVAQRRIIGVGACRGGCTETVWCSVEQRAYLVVGGLAEIAVSLPHGEEVRRRSQAHHLIGVLLKGRNGIRRPDRRGQHNPSGAVRPGHLTRRLSRRAGGDTVVDDQRDAARQGKSLAPAAVELGPAPQLRQLLAFDSGDIRIGQSGVTQDIVVEHPHSVFTDRTECQLRLIRHAELADHQHVEGGTQRLGDLERDRHAAARQTENDDVLIPQAFETPGQLPPRVCPIVEAHSDLHGLPFRALSGLLRVCPRWPAHRSA